MKRLFSNPVIDGVEDFFFEESLQYEIVDDDITATAEYNFFVEEYENLSKTVQETVLPNFYAVSLVEYDADPSGLSFGGIDLYDDVQNHALLYGNSLLLGSLQENGIDIDDLATDINEFDYSITVPYKRYLSEWSKAYTDLNFEQTSDLMTQGKNIIQTYSSYNKGLAEGATATIEGLNERSLKMPFGIKLAIVSEGKMDPGPVSYTTFADTIGDLGLTTPWVSHIISSLDSSLLLDPLYEAEYEFISKQYQVLGGVTSSLNVSPILKRGPDYKSVSRIEQEIVSATSGTLEDINSGGSFSLANKLILDAKQSIENEYAHELNFDFESYLGDLDFKSAVEDYQLSVHEPGDSWESVSLSVDGRLYNAIFQDGFTSPSHTLGYRVKKHRGGTTANVPVQDIWIPNAKDLMEYVDTQVRYGEQYTYDIYAYKYVFGTRYRYRETQAPSLDVVEIPTTGEAQLIGYNFSWFGAKNLFDIHPSGIYNWQQAALDINAVGLINVSSTFDGLTYDTFKIFNYYVDETTYPLSLPTSPPGGTDMRTWPAWTTKTTRFFTLNEIKSIMSQAWVVKPRSREANGVEADSPSWQEMWGQDWDDNWINEDTPMTGGLLSGEIDAILRGVEVPFNRGFNAHVPDPTAYDPADFSLENWFHLFMGFDSGTAGRDPGNNRPQPTPPSHHRLNGIFFGQDAAGPEVESNPLGASWSRNTFVGLEVEGTSEAGRTSVVSPSASVALVDGFHGGGLGISDVLVGEGIPLVEVNGYKAQYEIEMFPCTRIVEAPYATLTTSVLSKPPPPPEVEIIPYRAVNDELLFTFDATIAEMEMVAIPITQEDESLFDKQYQAQSVTPGDKLIFQSDDIPAFFEVFRLNKPPNRYSDFAGAKRATVSTLIDDEEQIVRARSTDYIDKLQPNVKYYYTFRTVDFHGNVSNPTFIYEVELVDDGGAIYPLINLYQLPVIDSNSSSKTMKKLIQIYPVLEQVTANLPENTVLIEDPNDIGEVKLGSRSEGIWGKTFKIRLTSKKTGKKIDMNVTFEKEDKRTTS